MTATRAETLADALREAIRRGAYVSGDRLVELRLAEAHGVSQATVRDALRTLEREGWVASQPRRGVTVRAFTQAECEEVFALMAALESLALRWLFPTLNKAARDTLRGHVRAARRASLDGKPNVGLTLLFEVHLALARWTAAEHPMTADMLNRLHISVHILEGVRRTRTRLPPRELDPLIGGHDRFCDLLDARDLEGADAALRRQILHYGGLVHDVLSA